MQFPYPTIVWAKDEGAGSPDQQDSDQTTIAKTVHEKIRARAAQADLMGVNPMSLAQVASYESFLGSPEGQTFLDAMGEYTTDELKPIARKGKSNDAKGLLNTAYETAWAEWTKTHPVKKGHLWLKGVVAYEMARAELEASGDIAA